MPARQLPVSPDVQHVKHEAKHLLRAFRAGDASALADFREFSSAELDAAKAKLSDAQLVLARSYGATSFPQLIAAVEFIRACWSEDGNRVREAVLAHAEILKDYYKTPHDGWREDLRAAAMQGGGTYRAFMRDSVALIVDDEKRQAHTREWAATVRILHTLGFPFPRAPRTRPIVILANPEPLAEGQAHVEKIAEKADLELIPVDEEQRSRLEQIQRQSAQDPTKTNRMFERMRAHDMQFPAESVPSPELRRNLERMNECLRLYIESHPLQ